MTNPRVFFDISINGHNAGRIVMELFNDVVPKTVSLAYSPAAASSSRCA